MIDKFKTKVRVNTHRNIEVTRHARLCFKYKVLTMNSKQTTIPKLLDYKALTLYYGLYKSTISKLVMNGKFTNIVKVGRKNYFRREDIEAWIDAQTIEVQ